MKPYHGSVATHVRLLNVGREVIRKLAKDPRVQGAAEAMLCHADLHKETFSFPMTIPQSSLIIIDWQSSSIKPAFEYADYIPDFAAPLPEEISTSPENKEDLSEEHNTST